MRALQLLRFFVATLFVVTASIVLSGCSLADSKKKSGLQVITNDVPSSLFIDGQYLEKTPYINKEIQPGTYTLRIQPDDPSYQPHETSVTLRQGLLSVVIWKPGKRPELSGGVVYEMEKLPNKNATELSIRSIPDGAIVSINDGAKEFSPLIKTELPPGEHRYQVSLPSYETQQHTVNLEAGHRVSVFIKLAKSSAEPTPTSIAPPTTSTTTPSATPPLSINNTVPSTASASTTTIVGPKVTIKSTGFFVNSKEVLRVRNASSSSGLELGYAPVGAVYPYLNESGNGWNKISFEGKTGWVTADFSTISN